MGNKSRDFVKNLSDHQIADMVEELLSDTHSPMSPARDTYIAAYNEAKTRPVVWDVITTVHPHLKG